MTRILLFIALLSPLFSSAQLGELVHQYPHPGSRSGMNIGTAGHIFFTWSYYDKEVKIYDYDQLKLMRTQKTSRRIEYVCGSSSDQHLIAKVEGSASPEVIDVETGELSTIKIHTQTPLKFIASKSQDVIFIAQGPMVSTYDITSGTRVHSFRGQSNTNVLAHDQVEDILLLGSSEGIISAYQLPEGRKLWTNNFDPELISISVSHAGNEVAAMSADGAIAIYDIIGGQEKRKGNIPDATEDEMEKVMFINNDKQLACLNGSVTRLSSYDATNFSLVNTTSYLHRQVLVDFDIHPEDLAILTTTFGDQFGLWDEQDFKILESFGANLQRQTAIACSPDGELLASTPSESNIIEIRSFSNGEIMQTLEANSCYRSQTIFLNGGSKLLSNYGSSSWAIWEIDHSSPIMISSNAKHNIHTYALDESQQYLASISHYERESNMAIWNTQTGELLKYLENPKKLGSHSEPVIVGKWMYLNCYENQSKRGVYRWDIKTGKMDIDFVGAQELNIEDLSYSKENNQIVVVTNSEDVYTIDPSTGATAQKFESHRYKDCLAAKVSPDMSRLYTGLRDGSFNVFDMNSGQLLFSEASHKGILSHICVNDKYGYALSVAYDDQMILWDTKAKKQLLSDLYARESQEHVYISTQGYFDGNTVAADEVMAVVNGTEILPLSAFTDKFLYPDLWSSQVLHNTLEQTENVVEFLVHPPVVKFTYPKKATSDGISFRGDGNIDLTTSYKTITLKLEVEDHGAGLKELILYQNGKEIRQKDLSSLDDSMSKVSFDVELSGKTNTFKATVKDKNLTASQPAIVTVQYDGEIHQKVNLYIMAIGIDDYENDEYDLSYAVKDAKSFVESVKKGAQDIFHSVHDTVLLNSTVSKASLIEVENIWSSKIQTQDVFIFFYAGHGISSLGTESIPSSYYLVPPKVLKMTKDEYLAEQGYSQEDMRNLIRNIKAEKQAYFLDACQSVGALDAIASRGAAEERAIAVLAKNTGTHFLAASQSDQSSLEYAELGHGVFTHAVLNGLKGGCDYNKNKNVDISELCIFVEYEVQRISKERFGRVQHPGRRNDGKDFPIAVAK